MGSVGTWSGRQQPGIYADADSAPELPVPVGMSNVPEKGARIEKRKRQKTDDRVGRALSEYCSSLEFIFFKSFYTQSKKVGQKTSFL